MTETNEPVLSTHKRVHRILIEIDAGEFTDVDGNDLLVTVEINEHKLGDATKRAMSRHDGKATYAGGAITVKATKQGDGNLYTKGQT